MNGFLRRISLVFAAGAAGGLATSIALWATSSSQITLGFKFSIGPSLTVASLYPGVVWGGIWGALFLIPVSNLRWLSKGLLFSLAPTIVHFVGKIPIETPAGVLGHSLGTQTLVAVIFFNAIWGVAAALWLSRTD